VEVGAELQLLYFRMHSVPVPAFCFGRLVFRVSTELLLLFIQWHCRSDHVSALSFRIRSTTQWWTVLWQVLCFWWTDQYRRACKVGVRTSKSRC